MTEASTPPVTLERVAKSFTRGSEKLHVLRDISLHVRAGELVVVSGPSGSGKSTLFDIVLGWQFADSGVVQVDTAGGIGIVPQGRILFDELSAIENVAIGDWDGQLTSAAETLRHLGLDEVGDRRADELSLGQQQRVAVARAIHGRPAVIIADEPTSHQDAEHADLVMGVLRAAAERGAAALISSHDPRVVDAADRQIRLNKGSVVSADHETGPISTDLRSAPTRVPGLVGLLTAVALTLIAMGLIVALA